MRRMRITTLGVFLISACSSAPFSFVAMTPAPSDSALSCALRQINTIGYTVTDKNAGFIAADKRTSGFLAQLFINLTTWSALTVSVFDGADGEHSLRATAWQTDRKPGSYATRSREPTKHGISDANGVLTACGKGEIRQQSCDSRRNWKDMSSCAK